MLSGSDLSWRRIEAQLSVELSWATRSWYCKHLKKALLKSSEFNSVGMKKSIFQALSNWFNSGERYDNKTIGILINAE